MIFLIISRLFWKQIRTVAGFFQRTQKMTLPYTQMIQTTFLFVWSVFAMQAPALADVPGAGAVEFFEKKIRPVLSERCYKCHSKKAKGGLRLNARRTLLEGGESGAAVIPGKPGESLLIDAIHYGADSYQMPPDGKLPPAVIKDFEQWIRSGAPWPDGEPPAVEKKDSVFTITPEQRTFWSFQPVRRVEPPSVADASWGRNDLDRFVLRRLEEKNMQPSRRAGKRRLLRRATFDLTGLPPTLGEIESFLADDSPGAFAEVVDRLLESPRYGEHWARHWLDGVRYVSDVGYYNFSDLGWRYRDWVIRALNQDLPYDQFVVHQLAGDLLPSPTGKGGYPDGVIATGVLAMGNYDDQESNKEQLYAEVIDDQIDLVSRQFLGLTISCARCHDHKFDPISTADYYSLGGIFLSSRVLETKNRIGAHRLKISLVSPEGKKQGTAIGIQEGGYSNSRHKKIGDMPIYIRGDPSNLGPVTPRRFPQVLAGDRQEPIGQRTGQSGRLELAGWIANPKNPLTARVMVNRIWQFHFGRGLVRTPNNFGSRGGRPSHPQLLDYLADRFVKSRWSLKSMHRLVMNSATYQQDSAKTSSRQRRVDPENVFLGRFSTRRLTAEELHDSLQAVSGRPGKRAVYTRVGHEYVTLGASLFDGPATGTIVPIRTESTTAPQGLYMMNDEFVVSASRSLADQLAKRSDSDELQIRLAYELVYGRVAGLREIEAGRAFLATRPADQRWVYFQVLLCSNEFMYLD